MIDLNANRLPRILAHHHTTPEQLLAEAARDEYGPEAETIAAIQDTEQRIPVHYRTAVADHPDVLTWAGQLIDSARAAQARTHTLRPFTTNGRSLLLIGPTGVGKALLDSTEIATPIGPRPIGTLRQGDTVFGGDGEPCQVVGVYPQGVRSLWRLHLRDGRSVVCDAEHLWLATTRSDRGYGIPPKVVSLDEMMRAGFTYADGSSRWYLPVAGTASYPTTELPIDAYTLGALIGDGGLTTHTPAFTTADPEILNSLRLPAGITPRVRPRKNNSQALTWLLSGRRPDPNPLTVALRSLGLMGRRSSERFIPDCYLLASAEDRLALLAGLVDTDGYVKGTRVSVSTSSPRLAADIQCLVWSLGGSATARRRETTHLPSWTVQLALPPGFGCPARLTRKRDRWAPRRDGRGALVAVIKAERVPDGHATCIAVDSPDSTYLTADYVRTHNTHQAYGALRHIAAAGVRSQWRATPAADLYAQLRPRHNVDSEAEFRKWAGARLLLVDDIGAAKSSEWIEEVNYRLVNHRYENELPTLFTSNLTPKELADRLGERVFSRLVEMCQRIALKGDDRRRHAA